MQGELLPQLCFFVTPSRPAVPPSRTQLCPANSEKEHLVICGHVDSGKSTTTGRLIFELACFPERKLEKLKQEAKRLDKGSFAFAFHMGRQKEERERGRDYLQRMHQCLRERAAAADSHELASNNAAPRLGAERDYLQRLHRRLRKGAAAADSHELAGSNAAPR